MMDGGIVPTLTYYFVVSYETTPDKVQLRDLIV